MTAMHVLKLRLCSSVWTFFQTNALPSARVAGESASWERRGREREQKNVLTGLVSGDGFPNTPLISAVPNSITEHEHESSRHFIGTLELTSSNNFWQILQKPPPRPLCSNCKKIITLCMHSLWCSRFHQWKTYQTVIPRGKRLEETPLWRNNKADSGRWRGTGTQYIVGVDWVKGGKGLGVDGIQWEMDQLSCHWLENTSVLYCRYWINIVQDCPAMQYLTGTQYPCPL